MEEMQDIAIVKQAVPCGQAALTRVANPETGIITLCSTSRRIQLVANKITYPDRES